MSIRLKISAIVPLRIEDGPGIRTTIFFHGCSRKCEGCHNKSLLDGTAEWEEKSIREIFLELEEVKNPNKRVTISGGEPLEQKEGLTELINYLNQKGYDIALYTSYNLDEIPQSITKKINYIKVGHFISSLKVEGKYYGSSNQKFIHLCEGEKKFYE